MPSTKFARYETVYYYGTARGLRGESARVLSAGWFGVYCIEFFNIKDGDQEAFLLDEVKESELRSANEHLIHQVAETIISGASNKIMAMLKRKADRKAKILANRYPHLEQNSDDYEDDDDDDDYNYETDAIVNQHRITEIRKANPSDEEVSKLIHNLSDETWQKSTHANG